MWKETLRGETWSKIIDNLDPQGLKVTQKVSFYNIASEASYVYI